MNLIFLYTCKWFSKAEQHCFRQHSDPAAMAFWDDVNSFVKFQFLKWIIFSEFDCRAAKICSATLTKIYNNDLDATEFMSEVESFKFQGELLTNNFKNVTPIEITQLIHTYALKDIY